MKPGVRVCVPSAAVLGLFCRGCLSRSRSWPGRSFSSTSRQMSRWNSQDTSPPSPQENVRVLITGDANFHPSLTHNSCLCVTLMYSGKDFSTVAQTLSLGSCHCFLPLSLRCLCSELLQERMSRIISEQSPSFRSNQV